MSRLRNADFGFENKETACKLSTVVASGMELEMGEAGEHAQVAKAALRLLWEHHWWSFEQFLDAAAVLSQEELTRDLGTSYRSIHGALAHVVGAELVWLKRVVEGESMTLVPGVEELPDLEALRDGWERSKSGWQRVLELDDPGRMISYSNTRGQRFNDPLWLIMTHLVDHSATYLGVLIAGLRILGRTPPATGVIFYIRQR